MTPDAKMEIVLTARDAATKTINQATENIKSQLTGLQQRAAQLTSTFIKVSAAALASAKVWDEVKFGAKAIQERQAFENLAASYGQNADQIVKKLREASAETVNTMTLVNKAGTAMMMGIAPEKLDQLMKIARSTARMTGQEITRAFSDIALGVGRQSKMILDNLGIIVSVEQANETYAASLNKTAAQLTDVERKTAFLNATIAEGEKIVQRVGDTHRRTAAEMFQSWEAMSTNFREIASKGIVSSVQHIVVTLSLAQSTITQTLEQIAQGWSYLFGFIGKMPGGELLGFKALSEELQGISNFLNTARMNAYGFIDEMLRLNEPLKFTPVIRATGETPQKGDNKLALKEYNDLMREADRLQKEALASLNVLQTQSTSTWQSMAEWIERNNEAEREAIALAQQWHQEALNTISIANVPNMYDQLQEALGDPDAYFGKITDSAKSMSEELREAVTGWASGFSKTLSDMVWDAEVSFASITESFGRMITQMIMQRMVVTPMLDWFNGLFPSAHGNVFKQGEPVPFARGGIVDRPTIFPMAKGGVGLMGEAGTEAIMPLTRLPSGDLGVKAQTSNAAPNVKINVVNNTGQQAQVKQTGPSWNGQEWVIGVWLDAYQRNVGGLRSALGV